MVLYVRLTRLLCIYDREHYAPHDRGRSLGSAIGTRGRVLIPENFSSARLYTRVYNNQRMKLNVRVEGAVNEIEKEKEWERERVRERKREGERERESDAHVCVSGTRVVNWLRGSYTYSLYA